MFRYPGAFLLCVFLPLSAPVLADAGRRPRPVATAIGAAAEAIPEAPLKHSPLSLTAWERDAIGRQIWFNESRASHAGLTVWNPGEGFPSLINCATEDAAIDNLICLFLLIGGQISQSEVPS